MSDQEITYSAARNPRWANSAQTKINLEVEFDHLPNDPWAETTVVSNGDQPHVHQLYAAAVNGDFGAIQEYAPTVTSGDDAMAALRNVRNEKLTESDIDVVREVEANGVVSQATKDYRAALRDLPANNPNAQLVKDDNNISWQNVTWPTKP